MEYTLFDEFITLQALLKELGIIHSGGAIKGFLAENTVLFNGEKEERRGKKIRLGDIIELPDQGITITLKEPNAKERQLHDEEKEEKARVAALVKQLNKNNKTQQSPSKQKVKTVKTSKNKATKDRRPVRFPGT